MKNHILFNLQSINITVQIDLVVDLKIVKVKVKNYRFYTFVILLLVHQP